MGAKDSSNRLVAGCLRNVSQDSRRPAVAARRALAGGSGGPAPRPPPKLRRAAPGRRLPGRPGRMRAARGPLLVSRTGEAGRSGRRARVRRRGLRTASAGRDSRKVAPEVGTLQGVCNNPPAESAGPENGARASPGPPPGRGAPRVGGRGGPGREGGAQAPLDRPPVQISAAVAATPRPGGLTRRRVPRRLHLAAGDSGLSDG